MKINLVELIKTQLPQEIAWSIFHIFDTNIDEWKSILLENHLNKNYITVNWWSCDRVLLKLRIFEDGELFAGVYRKPVDGDDWILEDPEPVSKEYILFNLLKDYLL